MRLSLLRRSAAVLTACVAGTFSAHAQQHAIKVTPEQAAALVASGVLSAEEVLEGWAGGDQNALLGGCNPANEQGSEFKAIIDKAREWGLYDTIGGCAQDASDKVCSFRAQAQRCMSNGSGDGNAVVRPKCADQIQRNMPMQRAHILSSYTMCLLNSGQLTGEQFDIIRERMGTLAPNYTVEGILGFVQGLIDDGWIEPGQCEAQLMCNLLQNLAGYWRSMFHCYCRGELSHHHIIILPM